MRRAGECLGAAEVCKDNGFYADAVSRAYYAIMHGAKAALAMRQVQVTTHRGIMNQFGLHLVRNGLIETRWAEYISNGLFRRTKADYDPAAVFDAADARESCDRAAAFLNRIRTFIGANTKP